VPQLRIIEFLNGGIEAIHVHVHNGAANNTGGLQLCCDARYLCDCLWRF
jgi:hypothetical protein